MSNGYAFAIISYRTYIVFIVNNFYLFSLYFLVEEEIKLMTPLTATNEQPIHLKWANSGIKLVKLSRRPVTFIYRMEVVMMEQRISWMRQIVIRNLIPKVRIGFGHLGLSY